LKYEVNSAFFFYHPEAKKKPYNGFHGFGNMEDCEGVLGIQSRQPQVKRLVGIEIRSCSLTSFTTLVLL